MNRHTPGILDSTPLIGSRQGKMPICCGVFFIFPANPMGKADKNAAEALQVPTEKELVMIRSPVSSILIVKTSQPLSASRSTRLSCHQSHDPRGPSDRWLSPLRPGKIGS